MKQLFVGAALMCAAGPAFAQPPATPCLQQVNMYSFDPAPGNRALIVSDRGHLRYRVNFVVPCYNLQYHLGVRFKTFGTSNLSCVSRGDQVLVRDVAGPPVCMIKSVEYQTPALDQADAATAAARKKS
jgi:hypothetical protein